MPKRDCLGSFEGLQTIRGFHEYGASDPNTNSPDESPPPNIKPRHPGGDYGDPHKGPLRSENLNPHNRGPASEVDCPLLELVF